MYSGQFMTEFSLWQFDVLFNDRKNQSDFYQNRGLVFHYFGIKTKIDNLLMVTNNNLAFRKVLGIKMFVLMA